MKIALITGGTKGIGNAILKCLTKHNYFVFFTFNKNENKAKEIEENIKNTKSFKLSSFNNKEIQNIFSYFEKNNILIDLFVNNHAISQNKLLIDITENDYETLFDANLKSAIFLNKYVIKNMLKKKSGLIINISSIWGKYGASCESLYSASKAAINAFSKSIAKEYAKSGIRVNTISPGACNTDMLKSYSESEINEIKNMNYLEKFIDLKNIAKTVIFLSNNKDITGENIEISGLIK